MSWSNYIPGSLLRGGQKPTTNLSRAQWSNHTSQVLTGYDDSGQWVESERVWWQGKDLYEGSGFFYRVISWTPNGANYSSREGSG